MKELKISFIRGNSYRIEGAIKELLANKRAEMMLRSQLAYKVDGDSIIVDNENGIEQVASILKLVSGYIGATIVYDDKTSSDIAEFKTREEDFFPQGTGIRTERNHRRTGPNDAEDSVFDKDEPVWDYGKDRIRKVRTERIPDTFRNKRCFFNVFRRFFSGLYRQDYRGNDSQDHRSG